MNTLRAAAARDRWAIRGLIWRTHINPIGLDWRRFVVVVDEDERLLACGQIKPHGDGSRELASIAVAPERRGQGLARCVIEHLLAQAGRPLYLTCSDNLRELYERFGFRVLGEEEMPPELHRLYRAFNRTARLLRSRRGLLVMGWLEEADRPGE